MHRNRIKQGNILDDDNNLDDDGDHPGNIYALLVFTQQADAVECFSAGTFTLIVIKIMACL